MAKKQPIERKKPITGTWDRFGIQNHVGGMWTPETFESKEAAEAYLEEKKSGWVRGGTGLRRHKVVPVRVTVTARS